MNIDFDQMSIFDYTMPMIQITKPIRLIELFAGYGSQAMALERMGVRFEHYKVVEFDKYAVSSYNAVHGTKFPTMDITKVHSTDLNICNTDKFEYFMTYSFPCTDLSVAGKMKGMKKGSGTRSGLLWEVERILTEINESGGELPQILFMENVPQVISDANIKDFHAWQDFLSELGYTSYLKVLNARDYGVAQNRERCFMFSFLGKYNYKFPVPIPLVKTIKDYFENEIDEKYFLKKDICERLLNNSKIVGENILGLCKLNKPYKNDKSGFTSMKDAGLCDFKQEISSTITSRYYKGIGSHKDNVLIVAMRGRNPENPSDRTPGSPTEQRLEPNSQGICNALTSVQKDNMVLENLYRIRKLTPRECGRLMDVSDEDITKMEQVNSNSQLYKQFGNSIVVGVMVAMFKNLNIDQR